MAMDNYSLSDIANVTRGADSFGENTSFFWIFALLLLANGGMWGTRGDFGQYATAASQQEILFGQQFQNLDNKMDRLGNGVADATFTLNNSIKDGNYATQTAIKDCCCTTQRNIDSVRFDMSNYACQIQATDTANTQKILDAISQNKIESLQGRINQLELQNAMCGVVRYPNQMSYYAGTSPFCNNNGCGCGSF